MLDLIALGVVTTIGIGAGVWLAAYAWTDAPSKAFAAVIGGLDLVLGTLACTIWHDVATKLIGGQ